MPDSILKARQKQGPGATTARKTLQSLAKQQDEPRLRYRTTLDQVLYPLRPSQEGI
jgi:hypothetical protein